jgi:DNA-binding NtrC family response regulator
MLNNAIGGPKGSEQVEQETKQPNCVLVVEDHPPLRELIENVLNDAGYNVITAADGNEALRIVDENENSIDLLLTDLTMPGMTGTALVKQFQERSRKSPVVIMSGSDPGTAMVHPGAHFLQKPFTSKSLLAIVLESLSDRLR